MASLALKAMLMRSPGPWTADIECSSQLGNTHSERGVIALWQFHRGLQATVIGVAIRSAVG